MNTSHLIILLVRFFAICLAIYSISNAVYSGMLFSEPNGLSIANLAIPISTMIAGILIWFMPYTLVRFMTGYQGKFESESNSISAEQFSAITFLTLSLYLAYRIVSDFSYWLYYYLNYENYGLIEIGLDPAASIFSTIFELFFFLVMVLGRRKIFFYLKKLRS